MIKCRDALQKIVFLNANGLSMDKFTQLVNHITEHPHSIFFIAETWFVNFDYISSHPFFVASSTPTARAQTGHRPGGIYCLASQTIHAQLRITQRTTHSLTLQLLDSISITALYLPPSMTIQAINENLSEIESDIVIGDINTYYHHLGASHDHPRDRISFFDRWMDQHHYTLLPPNSGINVVDHVFVKNPDILESFRARPPIIRTDHKCQLVLELKHPIRFDTCEFTSNETIRRFNIKYLNTISFQQALIQCFESLCPSLDMITQTIQHSINSTNAESFINILDESISLAISQSSKEALGEIDLQRTIPTTAFIQRLETTDSHLSAVKTFKRAMKPNSTKMMAKDKSNTPMKEAVQFFGQVFQQDNQEFKTMDPIVETVLQSFREQQKQLLQFNSPFGKDSLKDIIMKYPGHKSCGSDGLHSVIFKNLIGTNLLDYIMIMFRLIWIYGYTPKSWNHSVVHLIPKKSNSKHIDEFRPIALTLMLRRYFESLILRTIETEDSLLELRQLHHAQAGFRHGFSTYTHSILSNDRNPNNIRVFVDLKQAYDRVPVNLLLKKLHDRQCPPMLLSIIDSLFQRCSSQLVVNGKLSVSLIRERGLFQGSILSPILFSIFIDGLARELNKGCPISHPIALLFADDIQLIHEDETTMQHKLDIISWWCVSHGMEIGIHKCGAINAKTPLELSLQQIPCVTSYKYLGFPTTRAGIDWSAHIDLTIQKATATLKASTVHSRKWPVWVRLIVFKTFIRSQWEFGLCLLHHVAIRRPELKEELFRRLENLQDTCLKWISGLTTNRNMGALRSSLGILTIPDRAHQLAIAAVDHFKQCNRSNPLHFLNTFHKDQVVLPERWLHRIVTTVQEYNIMMAQIGEDYSRERWLKTFAEERLSGYGIMASLITRASRCKTGGPERFIREPLSVAIRCLAWRSNFLFHSHSCGVCGERFNRRHVVDCYVQLRNTDGEETESSCYNLLDQRLNECDYESFIGLLDLLEESMTSTDSDEERR